MDLSGVIGRPASYETMELALRNGLYDLSILAGDIVGPSGSSWQDVAGTAIANFQVLVNQLSAARAGNAEPFLVFPSPAECLGDNGE